MCGICGVFNVTGAPVDPTLLQRMNSSISHRGPDDAGQLIAGHVGLAMRRLSIIDLTGGSQPIWNEDNTVAIVYNGELYNFRDLTRELESRGHKFRTRSDTEAIVHAYEEWGLDALKQLRGMFAFAIWDSNTRQLLAARDRFGIKPLFYANGPSGLLLGSEIKTILAAGFPRRMDHVALDQYFSHFCVPTPRTIFEGIHRVPPGHALIVNQSGQQLIQYWDLEYEPSPDPLSEEDYVEQLRVLVVESVRRHLQSDVPLGAFLSGGLDSASVVWAMSRVVDTPIHTFTVGFDEPTFDERPAARAVAAHFGTDHKEHTVSANWPELLPRLSHTFDEPFGDYAAIPGLLVSEFARRHVKVVLSGDGGDELLAGYPTHYAFRVANLYRRVPALVRRHIVAPLVNQLPASMNRIPFEYRAKRFVAGAELPFDQAHLHWKVIFDEREKTLLYSRDFSASRQPDGVGFATFEKHFRRVRHLDPLSQLLYVDAKTFLLDDGLTRVDRTSMAHGLEVRVPLLDDELTEFLRRVPPAIKQPGWTTKHLLRKAMAGILPSEVVTGAKKGFTPPMAYWLQGSLKPYLIETLEPRRVESVGLFDASRVSQLVHEHLSGQHDHNRRLWALMSFMTWFAEFRPS
jgi:asparagine synthase (glutamine-hydrolysing)